MHVHCVLQELGEVALNANQDDQGHDDDSTDQQDGLNHLHVSRALHTTDENVSNHDDADDRDNDGLLSGVVNVEQHGDQGTCTGHLRDEVEQGHREGRDSSRSTYRALLKTEGQHVGHGELTDVTQRLCNQQQRDQPGYEEADGVKESVVTSQRDGADDTEEGSRREVVTRNGKTVLGTGELCATGVKV